GRQARSINQYGIFSRLKTKCQSQIGSSTNKCRKRRKGMAIRSRLLSKNKAPREIDNRMTHTSQTGNPPSCSAYSSCTIKKLKTPMVSSIAYDSVGAKRK